jgi:hypothetical protein
LEALVTASREELGPAASVLAWSEGEIMPVEQAVEALLG